MSEDAIRDENHVTSGLAVLNTDAVQGTNLVLIKMNAAGDGMRVTESATISFTMVPIDPKDHNYVNCMRFIGGDGQLYPWVATAQGEVLIDT